jgi:hypothetical protein
MLTEIGLHGKLLVQSGFLLRVTIMVEKKLGVMATQAIEDVTKSLDEAHDSIKHALGRARFGAEYGAPNFTTRLETLLQQIRNLNCDVRGELPT